MDGVLVIDKPGGMTSHDVVAAVRRATREKRIGHTGTLDPMATGVLPLACGRATRLVRFMTASDKAYDATIRFGLTTDTLDITGQETSRTDRAPDVDAVQRALAALTGDTLQTPPAFSAKKVGGRPAYEMARRAEAVALAPVPVHVERADLVCLEGRTARVAIVCSAGFYVRSFAHTLGEMVGTGACLEALRRTRSGTFDLGAAHPLEAVLRDPASTGDRLIPMGRLLPEMARVRLSDEGRGRVTHGQEVRASDMVDVSPPDAEPGTGKAGAETDGWFRLFDPQGELIALARQGSRPGSLHPAVVLI